LKYVTIRTTGQNVVVAWCPNGYNVLSGGVKLDSDGSLWYPPYMYFSDDGDVRSGTREGWQGTQLLDNDPSIPVTITVSARCAGH
jgi:hypothetical protein